MDDDIEEGIRVNSVLRILIVYSFLPFHIPFYVGQVLSILLQSGIHFRNIFDLQHVYILTLRQIHNQKIIIKILKNMHKNNERNSDSRS